MTHQPTAAILLAAALAPLGLAATGCIEHRVKTDPIHITLDVNLRVDEKLQEFFEYEREIELRVYENPNNPEIAP